MEEVRPLCAPGEIEEALELIKGVFDRQLAPVFAPEGKDEFHRLASYEVNMPGVAAGERKFYGAYLGDRLVGAAASRLGGTHVMFLYVDEAYQRRGIASALVRRIIDDAPGKLVTVNASPLGIPAYGHMGFRITGPAVTGGGMTFTPMEYIK